MNNRKRVLTAVLGLTLMVSLTLACTLPGLPGLGGPVTEEETPAPPPPAEGTPAPPPPAEVTPEPPPGEMPFELDVEALENLSSYAYSLHIDGLSGMAGAAEEVVLDIEGQRQSQPTKAEQLSFSSVTDGDATSMEIVYIEDLGKMWIREAGDAWQEVPVVDESMLSIFDAFSMSYWWGILFVGDPEDVQYVGQEMMNGVQSHHYRSAEGSLWGAFATGCAFASVQDDSWVAVDGNFPVKRELHASVDCQDQSGEINFSMEVRDINQPLNITAPM